MMENAIKVILENGSVGAILVIAMFYIWKLQRWHEKERAEWAKIIDKITERQFEVVKNNTAVLGELKGIIEGRLK